MAMPETNLSRTLVGRVRPTIDGEARDELAQDPRWACETHTIGGEARDELAQDPRWACEANLRRTLVGRVRPTIDGEARDQPAQDFVWRLRPTIDGEARDQVAQEPSFGV